MTISTLICNNRIQFPLEDLPREVKTNIVKRVYDSMVEETSVRIPHVSRAAAVREAARGLAKLNFVSQDFRDVTKQVMNEFPDIGMSVTGMAICNMAGDNQFQQKFVRLVQSHKHIEIPFNTLSLDEQKIVLEELSRKEVIQHLEKVKLDLNGVKLDASQDLESQNPENRDTSAKLSCISWMQEWMLGRIFKKQTYAEVPQKSLFQNFIETIDAMNRHGSQKLDIDLNLSNTNMDDQDVMALAGMLEQCKVSSLNLMGNRLGDAGASAIATALSHSKLTSLDLGFNHIADAGTNAIAAALPHSKLASLKLCSNEIGDAGAIAIASGLPHSELTSLDLRDNKIRVKGGIAIADGLSHSELTSLDLSFNNIGDEGAIAIADALPHSRLTSLNLRYNKIGDEGAFAIADAVPHSKLISLELGGTGIGYKGIRAIETARQIISNRVS